VLFLSGGLAGGCRQVGRWVIGARALRLRREVGALCGWLGWVWFGMRPVGYGMAWYGMVWHGL
jgi:hypothetical protein